MKKKVLIAAGGSGGHLYPAQALAEELLSSGADVVFIGGGLANNPYFSPNQFKFINISCDPLSEKNVFRLFAGGLKIFLGILKSYVSIRKLKPDIIVGFGSFHTLPALISAKIFNIPVVLHESNAVPGRVNRFLSPYALKTVVHFPVQQDILQGKISVARMPLRKSLTDSTLAKETALAYYSLEKDWPALLVFGGSQGALHLNQLVSEALIQHVFRYMAKFQVIHFTGEGKLSDQIAASYKKAGIPHAVKTFEDRMEYAWKAADLAITRAGACSLAEQIEFAVPGILVPYPFATDNHQEKNADAFIAATKGGIKFLEKELTPAKLGLILCGLLKDPKNIEQMHRSIAEYRDSLKGETLLDIIKRFI